MASIGNITPDSGATNSSGSVSFSHTSNSTLCEVWVGTADGGSGIQPTSVTVGGVSATKQSGATNTAQFAASQWVATGVASSGSLTVAISWSGSAQNAGYMAVARSIIGASGVGNVATPATSTANANPTITISTTTGRLVTAGAFNFAQQMSSGGGQTQDAYAGNLATFTVGSADHATAGSSSQVFSWTQTSNPNAGWVATALDYIDSGLALGSQTATFSQGTFTANAPAAPVRAAPLPPLLANKALGPLGMGGFALRVFPQTAPNPNVSAGIGAQTATFTQGTFSATSTGGAVLGSQTATFSQGTLTASSTGTATLGAQTATFSQGTFSISGAAASSSYPFFSRFPVNASGQLVITTAPGTSPFVYENAFKIDSAGRLVTATVSGVVWQNGFKFDANGNLFVTQTPTTPIQRYGAIPFDATGAMVISTGTIVVSQNGLGFDSNGYVVVVNG